MKTLKFLVCTVLISCWLDSFSQVLVGPVIGGQLGWVSFDEKSNKDLYTAKPSLSFRVGGSIAFRVQKRFFLQTSIIYSRKAKIIEGKSQNEFRNESRYRYIEMPILYTAEFKAHLKNGKEFKWYLGAGPTVSYWLGGKGVIKHVDLNENGVNPPSYELPYKITFRKNPEDVKQGEMNIQDPNRVQLGLNVSTGVIFEPWGMNKIMVTMRYEFGSTFLSGTSKGDFGIPSLLFYEDDLRIHNNAIALSLYYFIDLQTNLRNKGKSTSKIKTGRRKK